jgi:hypothetical protein
MGQGNRYLGRTGALTLHPLGGPQRAIDARMPSSTVQHPCNHLFRLTKTLLLSRDTRDEYSTGERFIYRPNQIQYP